jgi:hypothetical protein
MATRARGRSRTFAVLSGVGNLWSDVDERVLDWVRTLPPTFDPNAGPRLPLATVQPQPVTVPELSGMDSRQVDDSLQRLTTEGFVAGRRHGHSQGCEWRDLRLTAKGLQLFDEWPNFDQAASALGMHLTLGMLADGAADPDDKSALRRSAAIAASLGDAVLKGTLRTVATEAGKDAAE